MNSKPRKLTTTNYQALDKDDSSLIGVVVCKLDDHLPRSRTSPRTLRGYIAMLAVAKAHRGKGIATALVLQAIEAMQRAGAHEIALEAEESNGSAIRLYQRLGFLRSKKLHRYYLNGSSAYRLILPLRPGLRIEDEALHDPNARWLFDPNVS